MSYHPVYFAGARRTVVVSSHATATAPQATRAMQHTQSITNSRLHVINSVSLIGTLKKVDADSDEAKELTKCFLRRHHDAKWWLPGNKIHESFWVKLKVDKIYWIGGFGNVQQIGCRYPIFPPLPMTGI